jgi:holliday junction DNA helicase RuvA
MIAHLYGEVASTGDRWVVIDIGGVGYQVQVTQPALQELREVQGPVRVFTHMAVREDAVSLYGFTRHSDLELFKILIGVSGIGPQIAIGILSQISFEEFALAVVNDEERVLTRISGIGPKSAKRLILELKEKMKKRAVPGGRRLSEADDAVSALVSLGFAPGEAQDAIDAVLPGIPDPTVQTLIRAALARLREHRT